MNTVLKRIQLQPFENLQDELGIKLSAVIEMQPYPTVFGLKARHLDFLPANSAWLYPPLCRDENGQAEILYVAITF